MAIKYFTQYRPVEGEIKEGYYQVVATGDILSTEGRNLKWINGSRNEGEVKKVELFLCRVETRMVPCDDTRSYYAEHIDSTLQVMGKVSKVALPFIKEGQEFNREDFTYSEGLIPTEPNENYTCTFKCSFGCFH